MVRTNCSVYGCNTTSKDKDFKFHRFPRDERRQLWIEACQRPDLKNKTVEQLYNMHVCGLHFERWMYMKTKLKNTAIPVLNLPSASLHSMSTQTDTTKIEIIKDFTNRGDQQQIDIASVGVSVMASTSAQASQTTKKLTDHSPRKRKLRRQVTSCAKKLKLMEDAKSTDVTYIIDAAGTGAGSGEVHRGFKCNACTGIIAGFRYTCVQCANYDLCSACEAREEHAQHYVLRVPEPRPYLEVQRILKHIRSAIAEVPKDDNDPSLMVEVKVEPEQPADPLQVDGCGDISLHVKEEALEDHEVPDREEVMLDDETQIKLEIDEDFDAAVPGSSTMPVEPLYVPRASKVPQKRQAATSICNLPNKIPPAPRPGTSNAPQKKQFVSTMTPNVSQKKLIHRDNILHLPHHLQSTQFRVASQERQLPPHTPHIEIDAGNIIIPQKSEIEETQDATNFLVFSHTTADDDS